jgi:hypothetical protein
MSQYTLFTMLQTVSVSTGHGTTIEALVLPSKFNWKLKIQYILHIL